MNLVDTLAQHQPIETGVRDLVECSCGNGSTYTPDGAWGRHIEHVMRKHYDDVREEALRSEGQSEFPEGLEGELNRHNPIRLGTADIVRCSCDDDTYYRHTPDRTYGSHLERVIANYRHKMGWPSLKRVDESPVEPPVHISNRIADAIMEIVYEVLDEYPEENK